jgi:hypothetical protein
MMRLCDFHHVPICHDQSECPLCGAISNILELKIALTDAQIEIKEMEMKMEEQLYVK